MGSSEESLWVMHQKRDHSVIYLILFLSVGDLFQGLNGLVVWSWAVNPPVVIIVNLLTPDIRELLAVDVSTEEAFTMSSWRCLRSRLHLLDLSLPNSLVNPNLNIYSCQ